jgi:ribosomal protein S18 acetylase RimI-like enzyme
MVNEATPATTLSLRPAGPADGPLLRALFASGFHQELAYLAPEQRETFLELQWQAREHDYRGRYPDADDQVVVLGGVAVGRLLVARGERDLAIVDLALLPEFRGRGIGSELLRRLLDEATAARAVVQLHVAATNPAMHLYQRFGFTKVGESGPYVRLAWNPYGER